MTPVAAALLYYPTMQQQQQQQRMRTCSFSSTGSGSTGSAATPPLSPPRPGAFFPPLTVAAKPPSSRPEPTGSGSSGSPTGNTPSPPPVAAAQKGSTVALPARGNIFEHRADLAVFKAVRRAAQNAYHIRLDDDGPHGNDDVRRLLMRRLSAAGVRRFACVSCRCSMPVYDEFPLVDGTFFLSPRHYGTFTFVSTIRSQVRVTPPPTEFHIYNLDAVPPIYVVSNHVDTDKLTTANGGTFTSSSASRSIANHVKARQSPIERAVT